MRIPILGSYCLYAVAAALLSGCGTAPAQPNNSNILPGLRPPSSSPGRHSGHQLLFVSDGNVLMFKWPSMKVEGDLTGIRYPRGECTDRAGNVYIASDNNILEYSRTGSLLNTYNDTYGNPGGCAVNPTNGELAVPNGRHYCGTNCWQPGQVLIFSSPSSPPSVLQSSDLTEYTFAAYNSSGHLMVDGADTKGTVMLFSCGKTHCKTIRLSGGAIYFEGAVQWDGKRKTWVVFDQDCNRYGSGYGYGGACSYPVSPKGVLGTPTTYLNYNGGAVCELTQGVIAPDGKSVAGGDYDWCGYSASTVNRWPYPAGGKPISTYITPPSYAAPIGTAISTMN